MRTTPPGGPRVSDAGGRLGVLLKRSRAVLFDFDGPLCDLYAHHPANETAEAVCSTLRNAGCAISAEMENESDPLAVLRYAASLSRPDMLRAAEARLCAREITAARGAVPTAFGLEAIDAAVESGLEVAIASNNSEAAIRTFLETHDVTGVRAVVGRVFANPQLLKPAPHPLLAAARLLDVQPAECVMIGDSAADVQAARAAGIPVVGYAPTPRHERRLADADTLVVSMAEVRDALRSLAHTSTSTTRTGTDS